MNRDKSTFIGSALLLAGVAALVLFERRYPLRRAVEPGVRRLARNAAVGAITAVTVSTIERPIVTRVARMTEEQNWGLVPRLGVAPALRTAIAVVLLDYTLYWWHVLLHRAPALWRTHEPHHIDRDLDASTAVRFHFLEFLASIPWRCAQIAVIGADPRALALWQKLTLAEVLFHHSNLRLPRALERVLAAIVVTPRLHGLHHSIVREERDSNFSSGLTLWDRLHGTSRVDFDRDDVTIGLAGDARDERTLVSTLASPFHRVAAPGESRDKARPHSISSSV